MRSVLLGLVWVVLAHSGVHGGQDLQGGKGVAWDWQGVDELISQQRLEQASARLDTICRQAQAAGDEQAWTRALVRQVQLRVALHGYETAVRFLKTEPWPDDALSRVTLDLFYAWCLTTYAEAYSWEIGQRERVESDQPVDLKSWTREQIFAAALQAYGDVWAQRQALDRPATVLGDFLDRGSYPVEVRGTLRDAATYLLVELLANSSYWRAEQANEVYALDLASLIAGDPAAAAGVDVTAMDTHPLVRIGAALDDLEAWHRARQRSAAALEARLERLRRLRAAFTEEADRAAIDGHLAAILPQYRQVPWWAVGIAQLAEFTREGSDPQRQVRARALAAEGAVAYPGSVGGERCRAIVDQIDAPEYSISAMAADGPGARSIQVTHRNLDRLYFRAYALDLVGWIAASKDWNLLPRGEQVERIVGRQTPVAAWEAALPATPDLLPHTTYVTPPMVGHGVYLLVSSARAGFGKLDNELYVAPLILTDLVLIGQRPAEDRLEVRAVSGTSGRPRAGVRLRLYQRDWQQGHHVVARAATGADGVAGFALASHQLSGGYFVLGLDGQDLALDQAGRWWYDGEPPQVTTSSLVYTDRAIYRPLQTVHWKVLAYRGRPQQGALEAWPQSTVTVSLVDPNDQAVASAVVTTNDFGTASGEFVVPEGRPLGGWQVRSSLGGSGHAIQVEEYRRPTFEVEFRDPQEALRLNRPAALEGAVRYYFGLPVTSGSVRWRVTREPVFPWWWGWWREQPAPRAQTVAAGTSALGEDGTFRVEFTPRADERLAGGSGGTTYRFSVSAEVTDEGGETRSATRRFRLGFVAVEAAVNPAQGFFAGGAAELSVFRADLDGLPRAGEGRWQLFRLEPPAQAVLPADEPALLSPAAGASPVLTPGDRLLPRWDTSYSPERTLRSWSAGPQLARGTVRHDSSGQAAVRLEELPAGAYRLTYRTADEYGAVYETSREFIVAGVGSSPALPLVLLSERGSVAVGDTARLLVHSGLLEQPVFLDVFRSGRLESRRTLRPGIDPAVVEFPIGAADRGGFGVVVTAVRDHQFMQSATSVHVPWDSQRLQVSFSTFRDLLRPGARETWNVTVKRPDGTPAEAGAAEILAYMYDRSLDLFGRHSQPEPLSLYPFRGAAPPAWATVGQVSGDRFTDDGFAPVPGYPELEADRLQFYSGYGVGGPGVRHGGLGEVRPMRASEQAMAPAARPVLAQDAALAVHAKAESKGDERERAGGHPEPAAAADAGAAAEVVRAQFAETAFWEPHLLADSSGSATISFTVPDAVTAWNVWAHAVTRDLRAGSCTLEARSVKQLMVRPYVPRFLREGDQATLSVVVNNASDRPLEGQVSLDIVDARTDSSLLAAFGLPAAQARGVPFSIPAGGGTNLSFPIRAPYRPGPVAFRVVARAGDYSDGELRPLPVLPGRMHLAQSRFATLRGQDRRSLSFADLARGDDSTLVNDQLVVTVDAQLFYAVLQALPYLVDYPYECTEQTLNRFVSTGIVSSLYDHYPAVRRMAEKFASRPTRLAGFADRDPNRRMALEETPWLETARGDDADQRLTNVLDPRIAAATRQQALGKLQKAQTSLGAFPWWPGGPPSPYMTLYILHGLAKASEFGVEVPRETVQRGWEYMASYYRDELEELMARDSGWELLTFLNYVAGCYPDPSWVDAALAPAEREKILEFSFRHWRDHSPYLKGYLALTLARRGRAADAALVWDSVMDAARTSDDEGTFWAPEDRAWLWYNDTIETQAFALRTLTELDPGDARRHGLVQWLLLNKKLNQWKSTRATAEVIYSLVHYLRAEGQLGVPENATVTVGGQTTRFEFAPDEYTGARNQIVVPGDKVGPRTATVVVEKDSPGIAFASATWHFSTERLPEAERGDFFQVARRYYRRGFVAGQAVLEPLAEGAAVAVGDQVEVHLSLRARHAAEYVHLRDPRGAGFEPESQASGYRWDLGLAFYEEVRDSGTNFFIEWLPAGEYTLKYRLRASMAGDFRVGPATVQSMYAPEFCAYSAGAVIEVAPAADRRPPH